MTTISRVTTGIWEKIDPVRAPCWLPTAVFESPLIPRSGHPGPSAAITAGWNASANAWLPAMTSGDGPVTPHRSPCRSGKKVAVPRWLPASQWRRTMMSAFPKLPISARCLFVTVSSTTSFVMMTS